MKTRAIGAFRITLKLAIFAMLLSVGTAWGAIGACATATGTSMNTADGGTINNISDGCGEIDKSFSNFNVTTSTCTGGCSSTEPDPSNTNFWTSGTAPSGNTFTNPVDAFFSPITSGTGSTSDWGFGDLTAGETVFTTTYTVIANSSGTYNGGASTYPSPSAGLHWAIPEIGLTATGSQAGSTNVVSVAETFCLGATSSTGCTTAREGVIIATISGTTTSYTCTFDGATACSDTNGGSFSTSTGLLTFDAADSVYSDIFVSEVSTINQNTIGAVSLTDFENEFYEDAISPEPSTLLLLGTAMAGLCLLRLRRRRA